MVIEGTIEDIVFRNDENGYTVAYLHHGEEYSVVVGNMLTANIGETVRLEGSFATTKYGEQFVFTSCEIIFPSTTIGIEKYLASGLVKGVGPITAKNLVKEFGEDTLDVIEFYPEKLVKVKGISKNKADEISLTIGKLKKMQNVMMFLQKYNITTNMALKIFGVYQEQTIDVVMSNPYKLVEDIDGIGFLSADKIAKSLGVSKDSPFRMRAGLLHILKESVEKVGHTFLPKYDLIKETLKLLELDNFEDKLNEVLQSLKIDKVVNIFFKDNLECVMLVKYYFIEYGVAQKLATLAYCAKADNFDVSSEINAYETQTKLNLHIQQIESIKNSVNSGVSVITGGPGTGKTTIIKCIINILKGVGKKVLLVAPTGRASKRLSEATGFEAKTIHRALEVDFSNNESYFKYNERNPLDIDAIIIDEVSMVDVILFNFLLKALPRDCKLIMVGDKDQLPSVGAGNVLDDIIKSDLIKVNYLTEIFRQDKQSLIVSNAHLINNGEYPVIDNSSSDFFFEKQKEPIQTMQSVVELVTSRLTKFLNIDSVKIQVLAPLKAGVAGIDSLNARLQERINPASALKKEIFVGKQTFREGDKVMHIANNYNLEWKKRVDVFEEEGKGVFNGDIGYIHKIDLKNGEVTIWFEDGRECVYPRTEMSQLTLAYAITIHKSQGSEFDVVVIPVVSGPSMILTRNLIYTAVTRAKKMVVIVGDDVALKRMIKNRYTQKRYTMLKDFLQSAGEKAKELYGEIDG